MTEAVARSTEGWTEYYEAGFPFKPHVSAFVQIQDAIVAVIADATSGLCASVQANRLRPVAMGKNAVVVRIEQSTAADTVTQIKDWRTLYVIECYAHARPGTDPLREADLLVTRIAPVLSGLELDASLSVLRVFGSGGIRWQFDDANDSMVCALIGFEVLHRTPINSTEPWRQAV